MVYVKMVNGGVSRATYTTFLHNIVGLRVQLVTQQILLRHNLVVADYQQCCGKSCMNLLPILPHLYRLRYTLQSKSTLLID